MKNTMIYLSCYLIYSFGSVKSTCSVIPELRISLKIYARECTSEVN